MFELMPPPVPDDLMEFDDAEAISGIEWPLQRKRSQSEEIPLTDDQKHRLLMKHAEHLMQSKVQRAKQIEEKHAKTFIESSHGDEFREFRKTGIAAHISNLKQVYIMYLNTIDKRVQQKKELNDLLVAYNQQLANKMMMHSGDHEMSQ